MVVRSGWIGLADDECAAAEAEPCRGAGRRAAALGDAGRSLVPPCRGTGPVGAGAVLGAGAGAGQGWDRACGVPGPHVVLVRRAGGRLQAGISATRWTHLSVTGLIRDNLHLQMRLIKMELPFHL